VSADAAGVGEVLGGLRVGRVAHGGHWVARADDGRVVFVRGALEGEFVRVRVTATAKRHAFGDVVEVLQASPDRVEPPCPIAADCGGCDFQHVRLDAQAGLKRQVVAEQLGRLAGLSWEGQVERLEPLAGWRTRVRYHADAGAWGMHPHRSGRVTPLPDQGCLIAAPGLSVPPPPPAGAAEILGVAAADGVHWLPPRDETVVRERAAGRDWRVRADGFWQVHPAAADTLVDAVVSGLAPRSWESALDLYCGVGLFAGALADHGVRVTGIEGSRAAASLAAENVPGGRFLAGSVDRQLRRAPASVDLVVLDPPRTGAGASVLDAVLALDPRAIAYVACDPAALARDLGRALASGWHLASLRAFDLFPMTHHIECVAILEPDAGCGRP
jgi:tRNA/tmRNA/rRNA uracil-C5-methylase (TrmA/RlmC/RlmD family)